MSFVNCIVRIKLKEALIVKSIEKKAGRKHEKKGLRIPQFIKKKKEGKKTREGKK